MLFLRSDFGEGCKIGHGLFDAYLFKVDLHDLISGGGLHGHHLTPAEHLVLHNVAGFVVFGVGRGRFLGRSACKGNMLFNFFLRCTAVISRAILRTIACTITSASTTAAVARTVAAGAAAPVCVGRAKAAALACIVLVLTLLVAVIPPLMGLGEWKEWIHRGLLLLVISCPCALVLSVPLTFFAGLARQSSNGVMLKAANVMETLCGVKAVALDKTGTITRGNFVVAKADCEDGFEEGELIELAAALEAKSTHPIAHAIVSAANGAYAADSMEEVAGCGVKGSVNGKTVLAGNSKHMKKENISYREHAERGTTVYVAVDGKYAGCIVIDDTIKPQSKEAVAMMKKHGLDVELLTGDNQASAAAVAKEVGIENVHASLMPGDKLDTLKKIRAEHGPVAFVGDGINDSVVLSGADVGCAMGAGGTDAAVEAADMVIMGDELTALPKAIDVSKRTMLIAKENVVFALAIKLIVMILGITGHAEMWMAVFADVGAALICVLNAVRLLPAKKAAK